MNDLPANTSTVSSSRVEDPSMNDSATNAPIDIDCATSLFFLLQAFDHSPCWKPGVLGYGFDSIVPEVMRYATTASPLSTFFASLNWEECGGVFDYEVPEAAARLFADAITETGSLPTADDVVEMFRKCIAADSNFAGMLSPSLRHD